jgi:hypothetical protein
MGRPLTAGGGHNVRGETGPHGVWGRRTAVSTGAASWATAREKGASAQGPQLPLSWGERRMRCCHSEASGHGEQVVATNHVTLGNDRRALTVTTSQEPDTP